MHRLIAPIRSTLHRLAGDRAAVATIEFAMALPILVGTGMYGTEVAYMASVNMELNQIATSVADNASRLGQTDNSAVTPTVTEADIDSVMQGALKEGERIDLEHKGRVILTSLEYEEFYDKQYIHWQRCSGDLNRASIYGNDSNHNGLVGGDISGLGRTGSKVEAVPGSAVMFVEVFYRYEGLFGSLFTSDTTFRQEAAFTIRDDRNLTPGVTGGGGESSCS